MKTILKKSVLFVLFVICFCCISAYAEEQETVFKLKNGRIVKIKNPSMLMNIQLKMTRDNVRGDIELLHLKRVEFTDNNCIATFHNSEKMIFPIDSLHELDKPVTHLLREVDGSSITISEIASIDINKKRNEPIEGRIDAVITDSSGKVHEAFFVGHISYVPHFDSWENGYAIHIEPNDSPWRRYLWIWDIKSARRIKLNLFEFKMKNGETIIGRWWQQQPKIYTKVFSVGHFEDLFWHSLVNGDYVRFYTRVDNIDLIEFKSNRATLNKEANKDKTLSDMRPAIVITTNGEIKTDACFLAMATGAFGLYECYPQFVRNVCFFPEEYNSEYNRRYIPMKEVSSVEIFDKPNKGNHKGIKIHKKDGQVITGYILSQGESCNGIWNYLNCFPKHHQLICYQDNGALVIPLDKVRNITWE